MNGIQYPIKLSEDYRYWNTLIWQVPSWGTAIAVGVVIAVNQVGKAGSDTHWVVSAGVVRGGVLLIGGVLLLALMLALFKYRIYQAACVPRPLPKPPFGVFPPAQLFLQGALSITCGVLLGFGAAQAFAVTLSFWFGPTLTTILWIWIECRTKQVVENIEAAVKTAE